MHADTILARVLGSRLTSLHAKRASALLQATTALLHGNISSLTAIALGLGGNTTLKHRIKSVGRLPGNSGLHLARGAPYQSAARRWPQGLSPLLAVVGGPGSGKDQRWPLLRASVVVEGRPVTLHGEVHPQKLPGNANVHRRFLQRLSEILPAGVRLVVMADAGFHAPWFKMVVGRGREFAGRIRALTRAATRLRCAAC